MEFVKATLVMFILVVAVLTDDTPMAIVGFTFVYIFLK